MKPVQPRFYTGGEEKIESVLEELSDEQLELSDHLEVWTWAVLLRVFSIMKSIGDY